jgi:hypothetical protein
VVCHPHFDHRQQHFHYINVRTQNIPKVDELKTSWDDGTCHSLINIVSLEKHIMVTLNTIFSVVKYSMYLLTQYLNGSQVMSTLHQLIQF